MKIIFSARDTLVISPGEVYEMPDEIAELFIRRGKATIVVEEKKKTKKE